MKKYIKIFLAIVIIAVIAIFVILQQNSPIEVVQTNQDNQSDKDKIVITYDQDTQIDERMKFDNDATIYVDGKITINNTISSTGNLVVIATGGFDMTENAVILSDKDIVLANNDKSAEESDEYSFLQKITKPSLAQTKIVNKLSGEIKSMKNGGDINMRFDNNDTILKNVTITSGDGVFGEADIGNSCTAQGQPGQSGGDIYIEAIGVKIESATFNLGAGGPGGDAETILDCTDAIAKGGDGGWSGIFKFAYGADITGNFTVNVGRPGNGGNAKAFGRNGGTNEDGGNATAKGGNGGSNYIFYGEKSLQTLEFESRSFGDLRIKSNKISISDLYSGDGGDAFVTPGNGGDAVECGQSGGKAGAGNATGGAKGKIIYPERQISEKLTTEAKLLYGKKGETFYTDGKDGENGDKFCNDKDSKKNDQSVSANGCVIPEEELNQLFPPDVTVRKLTMNNDVSNLSVTFNNCYTKSESSFKNAIDVYVREMKYSCPDAKMISYKYTSFTDPCSIEFVY